MGSICSVGTACLLRLTPSRAASHRHMTNCTNVIGAMVCLLLVLALTLGVLQVHTAEASSWTRTDVSG